MDKANAFLPTVVEQFNTTVCQGASHNPTNLHRPLPALDDLDETLAWQEDRTVSHSLTVQYGRVIYLLEPNDRAKDLQRKKVRLYDYPAGTVAIMHQGTELPYSVFDKVRQVKQADIVSNKRPGCLKVS